MRKVLMVAAAATFVLAVPALSATPKTWYVAQNAKSSVCIVTPTKPNGTTYTMIGTAGFPTVAAATKDMDADTSCAAKTTTVSAKPSNPKPTTTTTPSAPTTPSAGTTPSGGGATAGASGGSGY